MYIYIYMFVLPDFVAFLTREPSSSEHPFPTSALRRSKSS